jgi:hypothetical protein
MRFARTSAAALGLLLLAYLIVVWLPRQIAYSDGQIDMGAYFHAARAVVDHRSPYPASPAYGPDQKPVWYVYAPQFAAFVSPLGFLSYRQYSVVWLVADTLCLLAFAFNLGRLCQPNASRSDSVLNGLAWFTVLCATP